MYYHSTRSCAAPVDSAFAVLKGLATDGGLYMPEKLPVFDWKACLQGSSMDMSTMILSVVKRQPGNCWPTADKRKEHHVQHENRGEAENIGRGQADAYSQCRRNAIKNLLFKVGEEEL